MHPKIGVSAPIFSLIPLDEMLQKAEKDFAIWEMIAEGTCRLPEIKERLKEFMESSKLKFAVHAPLSDINIASINPVTLEAARNEVLASIEIAGELGMSPVTVHIGFISPLTILNKDKARKIARESVKILDKASKEYGVLVAAENMPRTRWAIFIEPWELLEAIEGTEIGLCFDIGHANISENIEDFMPLVDRFVNIHIHDNEGRYDEHQVLGTGQIELKDIVKRLRPKYDGNWIIECTEFDQGVESRSHLEKWLDH